MPENVPGITCRQSRKMIHNCSIGYTGGKRIMHKPKKQQPIEESDCWKKELVHLMRDFYIPSRIINWIICSVERKIKPSTSCNEAYQRGWVMFKEYLLKQ